MHWDKINIYGHLSVTVYYTRWHIFDWNEKVHIKIRKKICKHSLELIFDMKETNETHSLLPVFASQM